jgi:hypothetical protein
MAPNALVVASGMTTDALGFALQLHGAPAPKFFLRFFAGSSAFCCSSRDRLRPSGEVERQGGGPVDRGAGHGDERKHASFT